MTARVMHWYPLARDARGRACGRKNGPFTGDPAKVTCAKCRKKLP